MEVFLVASVLFKYLMLKLKIFAGSLLCALDHNEFSLREELSRRKFMMNPCDGK